MSSIWSRRVLPLALLSGALACGGGDDPIGLTPACETLTGPTIHDTDITTSETWSKCGNPHIVVGLVDVQAANPGAAVPILTLGPGVQVQFDVSAAAGSFRFFRVGYFEEGGLIINGTPAEPVTFTSNATAAAPGDYTGIVFMSNTVGSSIKYLNIQNCGESPALSAGLDGCIVAQGAPSPILMQDVTVNRSLTKGVVMAEGSEFANQSRNINVSNVAEYPILIDPPAAHTLPAGGTYTSNARNMIYVRGWAGDITTSASWINPGIPYLIEDMLDIQAEGASDPIPVLTLAPGTTLRMARDAHIRIGYLEGGALVADGTPTQKITITADTAEAAFWIGIEVAANATSAMKLDNVIVEYGGGFFGYVPGDEGNILIRPAMAPFITNSIIRNSAECGLVIARYVGETGSGPDHLATALGNTFSNNPLGNQCGPYE